MSSLTVNGTELDYEVPGLRAAGPADHGRHGRRGHFDKLADVLADEFTLVRYDRRGNGRQPRPRRLEDDFAAGAGR